MTKRPDQHNLDQNEGGATDYKFRRKSEDGVDRSTEDSPPAEAGTDTPNQAMEARRQKSEAGREDELERARKGQEQRQKDKQDSGQDNDA